MWLSNLLRDLRYAVRVLSKSPGFTAAAVLSLALGIGANTAIFSVVNAVLLNPGGTSDPERIVAVRCRYEKLNLASIHLSAPDFADVRNSTQFVEHAAVMSDADFNYKAAAMPERLQGAQVSVGWFDVFGAKPQLGRVFRPEEDQPNANQEVVLAYATWKRLFGGDAAIIGKTVELNNKVYRVVGVMGPDFRWPSQADLWVPIGLTPEELTEQSRFNEHLFTVARLRPGVSLAQANTLAQLLTDRVRNGFASGGYAKDSAWGMFAVPITDYVAGNSKKPLLVLLAAVGFVLLIACSNIGGLMLARASGRSRELAVRAALGAGRWDLIRQTMLESLLLAFAGALLGLGICDSSIRMLLSLAPEKLAAGLIVSVDSHVLLFTALVSVCAGLLFGIAPALQTIRVRDYESLKEGGRSGTSGRGRQRARALLVVGEVALALVLLVGAGLFLRSLSRLQEVGTGFDPSGVMTATISLPESGYKEPEKRAAFYRAVTERLQNLPGVSAAAAAIPLPFSGNDGSASFSIQGRTPGPGDPGPHGDIRYVGPGYFSVLRIPIRLGRMFTEQDRIGAQPVVVIDENLAAQYWPGENPIGKTMRNGSKSAWSTIVGVVGHVKHSDLAGDTGKGVYYYPILQSPTPFTAFVLRTGADPAGLTAGIRDAVRAVDPSLPVHHLKTMRELVSSSLEPRRFVVTVLGFFALVALLMAVIGLYGIISYAVAQRTPEIGIRIALGAQPREVLTLVAAQGLRLVLFGVAAGFVAALSLSTLVSSQLFQVSAFDPLTFTVTATVLIAAALLASYIPARRAAKVDPMVALRYE
jgi:predicted permease